MGKSKIKRYQAFKFDFVRCEVCSLGQSTVLEPKVMAVLELLWRNQGKVISSSDIFDAVWPGRVYNPSLVQRAITLVRKALGEEATSAQLLVTYPKKGYALKECKRVRVTNYAWFAFIAVSLMLSITIAVNYVAPSNKTPSIALYDSISPLTQIQNHEYGLSQNSATNEFIFIRINKGQYELWHKQGITEVLLFTSSNKMLKTFWFLGQPAFTMLNDKGKTDFIKLNDKNDTEALLKVDYKVQGMPISRDNMIYFSHEKSLFAFDYTANSLTPLYTFESARRIISFSLALQQNKFAVLLDNGQMQSQLILFQQDAEQVTDIYEDTGAYNSVDWHPEKQTLLLAKNTQLLIVSLSGETALLPFISSNTISTAQFDRVRKDIYLEYNKFTVGLEKNTLEQSALNPFRIENTGANLFPKATSQTLLFLSDYTGEQVLYTLNNGVLVDIAHTNKGEHFNGYTWLLDGSIAYSLGSKLVLKHKQGTQKTIELANSVYVRGWSPHYNALLVHEIRGSKAFPSLLHLDSNKLVSLSNLPASCLTADASGNLYFIVNENVLMKQSLNDDVFKLNVFENNVVEDIFSDGDYLYVSLSNDEGRTVAKVDVEQGMIIKQFDLANNKMLAGVDEAGWFWFYVDMTLRSSLNRLYSH